MLFGQPSNVHMPARHLKIQRFIFTDSEELFGEDKELTVHRGERMFYFIFTRTLMCDKHCTQLPNLTAVI